MSAAARCAPGLWCADIPANTLPPWSHTRAFVVGSGGVGWLIDPGGEGDDADTATEALLRASGVRTLKGILLSHSHRDHTAGVAAVVARHGPLPLLIHPAGVARLPTNLPVIPLEGGRRLMAGAEVIVTLHTPGHASDHLAFWLPESRTLVAGDLVSGRGSTWVGTPDGDVADYLESLARASALDPLQVAPAHGPLREDGAAVLDQARAHRLARERDVWRVLGGEARDLNSLRALVYPALPEVAQDFASRTILAHLLKLMREGRVMHVGDDEQGPFLRAPGVSAAAYGAR